MKSILLLLLMFVLNQSFPLTSYGNEESESVKVAPHSSWSFKTLGLTPIQSAGRMKPLDSFANEIVLFMTGSRSYQKWNSVDLILSWLTEPLFWQKKPIIRVGHEETRKQFGLDPKRVFYSPQELLHNPSFIQYAQQLSDDQNDKAQVTAVQKVSPREQEVKSVIQRLSLFQNLISGQSWLIIPKPAPQAWTSLVDQDVEGENLRKLFIKISKAYQMKDEPTFHRISQLFKATLEGDIPGYNESFENKILAEYWYNQFRPFFLSWVCYLFAALFCSISLVKNSTLQKNSTTLFINRLAKLSILIGLSCHIFGIALRCFIAGRPPVTNMYESVIWVSLGIIVFALILYRMHKQKIILAISSTLAVLCLVAGDFAPAILDPSIQPLVPVLRSNYWLTIHVLTITLGYAAFALTLGFANFTLFYFLKKKPMSEIISLNLLSYRAMQFGVVLIAAGTILGGIWADYSWGRFWGWDPKEVWALITLLCYVVILHGRYTSWMGQFGFAVSSALSFLSVVMAWYGVNFILGVGLHSYGFATGGTLWVIGFVVLQLLYVAIVSGVYLNRKRKN